MNRQLRFYLWLLLCAINYISYAQPTLKAQVRYFQDTFMSYRTDSIVYTFSNGRSYHSEDVFNTNSSEWNYYLLKHEDFVNQFDTATAYHWQPWYPYSLSKKTFVNLYNSSNLVIKSFTFYDPTYIGIADYVYNTAGQLISIHRSVDRNEIDSFVYSGGNLIKHTQYKTSPTLYKSLSATYNYNSNNEITSIIDTFTRYSGSTYIFNTLYTYNSSHKAISAIYQHWDSATSTYTDSRRKIITYNTAGNPVSCDLAVWNGSSWVNQYQAVQGYMNPDVFRTHLMDWSGSNWVPAPIDTIILLYYNLPTNINALQSAKNVHCTIYPVPANGYINVALTQESNQPLSIALFNMQGQLISQWKEEATQSYTRRIPTDALPAGQYVLYINNKKEELYKQFSINH